MTEKEELSTNDPRCETCRWWVRASPAEEWDGRDIGFCCYHPPRVIGNSVLAVYPRTADSDYCSKFELR